MQRPYGYFVRDYERLEERKGKEEKRMKNRIERKRRLMENVSLEDGISV